MQTFAFYQNNPGGCYQLGMPGILFVRAKDHNDANSKAMAEGVYFDGVDSGIDCSCCGDRWDRCDAYDESWSDEEVAGAKHRMGVKVV